MIASRDKQPNVQASMNFVGEMEERPRYHANDTSLDILNLQSHNINISDLRHASSTSLDIEGFALFSHRTTVNNFRNPEEVENRYVPEMQALLLKISGADYVDISTKGVLRFAETSAESGMLDNSLPARFVHIDVSDKTAKGIAERVPAPVGKKKTRTVHYNIWRVLTPPPQTIPLAVCDARSVSADDLVEADAIFDLKNEPHWSFEGLVVNYNPNQQWSYFSDMSPEEVLVFKTNDSDLSRAHHVPHSAFDAPDCPPGTLPRASIEMRGIAYWYGD